MTRIRWIGDTAADVASVGGKAASVDRLVRLGLPAPTGFVVGAGVFGEHLRAAGQADAVRRLVTQLPADDAEQELRRIVLETPLPPDLARELSAAVRRLVDSYGDGPYAVRSSALQEDSAASSFAGQHETVLGVEPDEIESAIRTAWLSLWSARSIAYRRAHGFAAAEPEEMAVLVQPLIDARASAVVFTVNPVTGDREEIVVDTARGLGEQIVSGAVTADMMLLDRVTLTPRRIDGDPVVTPEQAAALADLCLTAERSFRTPLDVEAAHDGRQWWLLQARPITTVVAAAPVASAAPEPQAVAAGGV